MKKKILSYFKGDRKYFAIVFFVFLLIVVVGLVTPVLLEKKKTNWETQLAEKITQVEEGIKVLLAEKESELISVKSQIKNDLQQTLFAEEYEYGKLISLINQKNFSSYSIEIVAPNGKIIAWNNISAIRQEEVFPFVYPVNEVYFFNSPLVTYLTIIDTMLLHGDRFYLLLSKPIEKQYSLQNKFYEEISFSEELSQKYNTLFTVYYDPFSQPSRDGRKHSVILLNSQNSKIGSVNFFKPSLSYEISEIQETATRIQIFLLVVGLFLLTFGLKSDFQSIRWKSVRLAILIVYLAALRLILYWSGFPSRFLNGPVVDPSYFSSTFAWGIVKTPIEFFITNILLVIIGLKFFQYILEYFKENDSGRLTLIKFISTPLIAILAFYTLRGFAASVKSVVFDSTIRYFKEPDLIPSLPALFMNLNILLLGVAIVFVVISFVLVIGKFIKLLKSEPSLTKFVSLFVLLQISCFIFFIRQPEPLVTPLMWIAFLSLIFLVILNLLFREKNLMINVIYSSLIASVIAISMLNYFNLELERRSLKVIAYEVNRANKELLSYLVEETLRNSLQNEKLVSSLYTLNSNYDSEAFIAWSRSSLQRESLSSELIIFDRNLKLNGRFNVGFDEEINYKKLLQVKNESGISITEIESDSENGISYAGIVPISNNNIIDGFIGVAAKFNVENLGATDFPDFLESNKAAIGSVIDLNLVKIFEFADNKLISAKGNVFPSKEQREHLMNVELSPDGDGWTNLSFYGEDYITYVLKTNWDASDKTTVVSIKEKEIAWSLYNFFKIFVVHSIFILVLVGLLIFFRVINIKYSFRTKLLGAFLLVSIIPIVALAIYNREVVRERTNSAIFNELSKRSEYLENHVNAQIQKHPERDFLTAFENAGKELGIAFTIYENSERIFSSKKEYFDNRLIPGKLKSEVHYHLNYLSYREALTKEYIDNYIYDAYYRKIDVSDRAFILGVNDAFNKIELFYSPVDADVFLFGIYSFAVIVITLLSTLFANQISSPIRQLTRATNAVAQGDLSVQLENKEKGELKELLDGFNSMTNELQKNQNDIAELERESAWKEMAKQVAHEIKNPLTPMKLSVQQILAAYNDKKTEFDEILKKLSQAILNQIDNLSLIASEFSSFAKMPSLKLEEFDLVSIVSDTVHLFGEDEAKIKFQSESISVIVESDNSQLRRMFINLIRNSIQARASIISIKITTVNGFAIVDISDNGKGISPENQNKIFDSNFTTKEKGLGLGLKLIKRFLENTNGEIKLISSSLDGTEFRIRIPIKNQSDKA
jgi:signal transduction histidine kinase